jgi:hypothetical protein
MTARYYCTPDKVAQVLGKTLTAEQVNLLDQIIIESAEHWVEERRGQVWQVAAITDEAYYGLPGPNLYLQTTPIVSVQSVKARMGISATETTLVAGTEYEVRDLTRGWLYIPAQGGGAAGDIVRAGGAGDGGGLPYDRIRVSYTPATTVPAHIGLATALLAAHYLQAQLSGVPPGVESYSVGDLTVKFAADAVKLGVPGEVLRLVPPRLLFA